MFREMIQFDEFNHNHHLRGFQKGNFCKNGPLIVQKDVEVGDILSRQSANIT